MVILSVDSRSILFFFPASISLKAAGKEMNDFRQDRKLLTCRENCLHDPQQNVRAVSQQ